MDKRIIARVPREFDEGLDQLVAERVIENKSVGVRDAIEDYLKAHGKVPA